MACNISFITKLKCLMRRNILNRSNKNIKIRLWNDVEIAANKDETIVLVNNEKVDKFQNTVCSVFGVRYFLLVSQSFGKT